MAKIDKNTVVDTSQDDALTWVKSGSGVTLGPYPDKTYVDNRVTVINEPGGNIDDVQINASGKFAGDNGLTFNRTTDQLNVKGNLNVGGYIKGKIVTNRFNLFITGGTDGQVLSTDGTGNLTWIDQSGGGSGSSYSNSNVSAYLATFTGNVAAGNLKTDNLLYANGVAWNLNGTYANANVANYLPTFTGNVAAGNLKTDNLLYANGIAWSFGSTYSNANVANYLPTFTGNVAAGNLKTDNLLYANGVAWNLNGTYSNANVANYLPTYSGNLNGGNLIITNGIYAYNFSSTGTSFLTTLQVNAQSQLGSVGNVKITGGSANYVLTTDGTGNLSWQDRSEAIVSISNIAPNAILDGTMWWNSEAGRGYIKYNDQWVDMNPMVLQPLDSSIENNGFELSISNTGRVEFPGSLNVNESEWTFGTDGTLTVPGLITRPADETLVLVTTGNNGNSASISIDGEFGRTLLRTYDGETLNTWSFGNTGDLTVPGNILSTQSSNLIIGSSYSVKIVGDNGDNNLTWTFDGSSGEIQLPFGAIIDPSDDNFEVRGVENVNFEANAVVNIYTDTSNNGFNWQFGDDGNLTLPGNTFAVNYANGQQVTIGGGSANTGNVTFNDVTVQGDNTSLNLSAGANFTANLAYLQVRAGDVSTHIHLDTGNNDAYDQYFGNDNKFVKLGLGNAGNVSIGTYQDGGVGQLEWTFDSNGNLVLPKGGVVYETNIPFGGLSGNTIALKPSGGTNDDQQLLVYPTAGQDFNHLHLTSGNLYNTELFLGNDDLYVKIANTGNIVINSNDGGGNTAQWTFDTTGTIATSRDLRLQIPSGTPSGVSDWNGQGGWNQGFYGNLATTGGTGTGLTVDVAAGGGGYINISAITIHTPGSGYTDGDVITINNENNLPGTFIISVLSKTWDFGTTGILTLPYNNYIETEDANLSLGSQSNVTIRSNAASGESTNSWVFSNSGNLILPGGYTVGETGDTLLLSAPGTSSGIYMDWNSEISFFAGNAGAQNIAQIGTLGGVWIFDNDGALTAPGNISTTGNISANYILGNGSQLTGISAESISNGTSNVRIATVNGNVTITSAGNNVATFTGTGANITGTANITGNVSVANLSFSANAGQIVFNTTAYINGSGNSIGRDGSIMLVPYTGPGSTFPGVVIGGAGRLMAPNGSVHQIFNTNDVTFQVPLKNIVGSVATSTTTGSLQITGGAGITGNIYIGGSLVRTGAVVSTAWTTSGVGLRLPTAVYTDNSTAAGTQASSYVHTMDAPTLSFSNAVTVTNAATLYVAAPAAGTNATITTPYAIIANGSTQITGTPTTGVNSILTGPAFTPLPNTMVGFNSNVNSYTQLTIQNKSTGSDATTEFVATADNGSDTVNFLDMGIINSGYDNNTPTNSLGNIVYAADSYVYAQGNASATTQSGGNLAIGTTVAGKTVKFFAGGNTSSSLVASFANTGASITGNLSVSGNFSLTGNLTGSSPNVTLVAGNYSTTFDNTGTATFPGPIKVPTLPAFRVYGTLNTNIIAANTITSTNGATVDYNQGSYYNNTTGLFTAPVAGLYHCYGTVRVGNNNGLNQVGILKNNSTGGANVIGFWETDTNTGTAVHFSLSGYAKCVVGDTISLKVITGNVVFDSNDSWGVTFIG